jgi:hypothetical protein
MPFKDWATFQESSTTSTSTSALLHVMLSGFGMMDMADIKAPSEHVP